MKRPSASTGIFLGLLLFLLFVKLVAVFLRVHFATASHQALFRWYFVFLFAVLAALGLLFARLTDFPELWDRQVGNRLRLALPLFLGLVLGAAGIVLDRSCGISRALAAVANVPSIHPAFPSSLLLYSYSAVAGEIFFHYFPLPFLLWFFSTLLLARRRQEETFWVVAVAVSFWEPLTQMAALKGHPRASEAAFGLAYAENFLAAYLFRRAGFLAPVVLRLAYYGVWHIMGAGFI
jgi:hypothetical protein